MTLQKIVQQCCKYLIIMINKNDTTFGKTTLFYYNKVKQKRKFTCTIEKKKIEAWRNSTTSVEVAERLEI